jgi:hypothetical protein
MDSPNKEPSFPVGAIGPQTRSDDPPNVQPILAIDQPLSLKDAAAALGVPYHVVQRAARRGLVPTYWLGTSRPYVKLRDFINLMERSANR